MGAERVPQHNAGIDLVDLDINEAGMRLSLRITSWSEAGARMRSSVTSWSGKTCTAGTDSALRRVCPGRGNFGESHGCMSFRTAPSVQHRIAWMDKTDKNSQCLETYAMRKMTESEREVKDEIKKQVEGCMKHAPNGREESQTARDWDPRTHEQTARDWDPRTHEQTARDWDPRTHEKRAQPTAGGQRLRTRC